MINRIESDYRIDLSLLTIVVGIYRTCHLRTDLFIVNPYYIPVCVLFPRECHGLKNGPKIT